MSAQSNNFKFCSARQGSSILFIKKAIFLFSFVICFLFFFFTALSNSQKHLDGSSFGAEKQTRTLKTISKLDFAKIKLSPIKNMDELLKNLVLTFKPEKVTKNKKIYLRCRSFETFTSRAMKSRLKQQPGDGWPDFALDNIPSYLNYNSYKGNLTFFSEFGFELPAPSILTEVTAPIGYKPMMDARLSLSHSILEADQFEVSWITPQYPYAMFKTVNSESPYLQLDHVSREVLQNFMLPFAGSEFSQIKDLAPLLDYFEENATYKTDVDKIAGMHPVEQFLSQGMKGHCQHIAASFVAICRFLEIPARVAAGFTSDYYSEDRFIVLESMAHAWPEVLTTSGWVKIEIFVKNSEAPELISREALSEINQNLAQALEQRQQQLLKTASGSKRVKNPESERQVFENTPENIEAEKREKQEKKRQKESSILKNLFLIFAAILLLALIIKYFDKIMAFIAKLFKSTKKKESKAETEKQIEKANKLFDSFIEEKKNFELSGKDATDLFNRFLKIVELKSGPIRQEHETASEYLKRFCNYFNLPASKGVKAANFLEAELYGEEKVSKENFKEFAAQLKSLLAKLN